MCNESQLGLEVGTSKVTRGNQRQLGGGGQLEQLGVTEINQNSNDHQLSSKFYTKREISN